METFSEHGRILTRNLPIKIHDIDHLNTLGLQVIP